MQQIESRLAWGETNKDYKLPVEWLGLVKAPSLVYVTTMAINALSNCRLTVEEVRPFFPTDVRTSSIQPALQQLEDKGIISNISYRNEVVRNNPIFPRDQLRSKIFQELKKGNLVHTISSVKVITNGPEGTLLTKNQWEPILIHGFHERGSRLSFDVIRTKTGPQELTYNQLKETLDVIQVPITDSFWWNGSVIGFYGLGVFSSKRGSR